MVTGLPSGSPNLSLSAPSLSPVCSSEDGGRAVSPLPSRHHGGPVNLSDRGGLPASLSPGDNGGGRLSHQMDPSQFLGGGDHNASSSPSAAAAAAAGLSLAYPRLSGMSMAALGSMPSLSYASGEQNPYSSLSMENFYNPLVSETICSYCIGNNWNFLKQKRKVSYVMFFIIGKSLQLEGERWAGYVGLEQLQSGRLGRRLLPLRHLFPGRLWLRRCLRLGRHQEKRYPGVDGDPEGLAQRAQEESISNQGGEDHARHHLQDDPHTGIRPAYRVRKGERKI